MKKRLIAALCIFALLFTMAGCSAADTVRKLDTMEDRIETRVDAVEDKLEDALRKAVDSAPPAAPTSPAAPRATAPAATESIRRLTEDQALQVALDYLGFSADQVTRLDVAYEIDDRIPQFDVSFHQGDWEHEFEIHAEHGQILSYDKDHKYD